MTTASLYLRDLFNSNAPTNGRTSRLFGAVKQSSEDHEHIALGNLSSQAFEEKLHLLNCRQALFSSLSSRGLAFCFGLTPIIYSSLNTATEEGAHLLDPLAGELPWVIPVVIVFNMLEQYLLITKKHQLELKQKVLEAVNDLLNLEKGLQEKQAQLIREAICLNAKQRKPHEQAITTIKALLQEIRIYRKRLRYTPDEAPVAVDTDSTTDPGKTFFYSIDTLETLWLLRENFYTQFQKTLAQNPLLTEFKPESTLAPAHNVGMDYKRISLIPATYVSLENITPALPTYTSVDYLALTAQANERRVEVIKRIVSPISRAIWPITLILTYTLTGDYLGAIFAAATLFSAALIYFGLAKPIYDKKKEQQALTHTLKNDVDASNTLLRRQRQENSIRDFIFTLSLDKQLKEAITAADLNIALPVFSKDEQIYTDSKPNAFSGYLTLTTLSYIGQGALALLMILTTFGAGSSLYALGNKAEVEQITNPDIAKGIGGAIFGISSIWAIRDLANNWRQIGSAIVQSRDLDYKEKCISGKITTINQDIEQQNFKIDAYNKKYAHDNPHHALFIQPINAVNEQKIHDKFAQNNPYSLLGNTKSDIAYTTMKIFKKGAYKAARSTSYLFFLSAVLSPIPGAGQITWAIYLGVFLIVFAVSSAEYMVKRINRQKLERRAALLETKEHVVERKVNEIETVKKKIAIAEAKLLPAAEAKVEHKPAEKPMPHLNAYELHRQPVNAQAPTDGTSQPPRQDEPKGQDKSKKRTYPKKRSPLTTSALTS